MCIGIILLGALVSAAPECATFTPKTCMHSEKVELTGRQCHPQICDFNADEVGAITSILTKIQCPLLLIFFVFTASSNYLLANLF